MPRASVARRQQGAASLNSPNGHGHGHGRHENSLVAPGKRVQKQKSNGHLTHSAANNNNTSLRSSTASTTTSTPTPTSTASSDRLTNHPVPTVLPATPPRTNGHARPSSIENIAASPKMLNESLRRPSMGDSESSSSESFHHEPVSLENHRRIDVNAAKNPAVHRDAGPVSLAITVLRSCPLYDTIAILIVLLQLPPTFLSIIHLLFTALTCVPPSISANSAFSFTDIFEGTLSAPSFATVVVVDMLVLLVWAFLWKPLQDIALDLAQIVIALTLGGGTSGRETGMKNILVCFGVIGASHLTRNGGLKSGTLGMLLPPSVGGVAADSEDPLDPMQEISRKGTRGLFRSIIAIHILTQGVVRCIRDWYVRREKQDTRLAALGDPEAAKGSMGNSANDSSTQNGKTTEPESTSSFPPVSSGDKTLSAKKKRKQSAQVRTRQPLWAALASTKIVMVKEYESSHTLLESAGANATDVHNLGNAPFDTEADRIWITYIGFDEVCFSTSYFSNYHVPENADPGAYNAPGVDTSKPFFVRVNQTMWQPTRLSLVDPSATPGKEPRWCGEIFGLAPMSNYECEFISTADGSVIFSASVRTLQAPVTDVASAVNLPSLAQGMAHSLRPGSPITTLKTSIATAETKLNEEKNRQKRERKEQRTKLNGTKKEIEKLTGSIASAGGNDDKLKQKVHQSNLHMKQAEESILQILQQLEQLDNMPDDDVIAWKEAKKVAKSEKDIHKELREAFVKAKQESDREVQSLTNDISMTQQKRERMQSRIVKLNGEHERITDANTKGLDEAQRKATERAVKQTDRVKQEKMYHDRIGTLEPQLSEMQQALHQIWTNIQSLQYAYMSGAQQMQPSPTTTAAPVSNGLHYDMPESVPQSSMSSPWTTAAHPAMSNTTGFLSPSHVNSPVPHNAQIVPSAMLLQHNPSQGSLPSQMPGANRTRGRSSSMLSNVSGFTQSSGEERQSSSRWHDTFQHQLRETFNANGTSNGVSRGDARGGGGSGGGSDGRSDNGSSSTGTSSSGPRSPVVGISSLGNGAAVAAANGPTSRWAGQWEEI